MAVAYCSVGILRGSVRVGAIEIGWVVVVDIVVAYSEDIRKCYLAL
jgi:hypothetical protein